MDNDADELKIHWNNKLIGLPRTCQKDLLQTFQLPFTEGSFIPFHEHFHQYLEQFYPNTKNIIRTQEDDQNNVLRWHCIFLQEGKYSV